MHHRCMLIGMRTTVNLPSDLQAEVDRLKRTEGIGTSDAIVLLARRGMRQPSGPQPRFVQQTSRLNSRIDISNIGEVLDLLDDA